MKGFDDIFKTNQKKASFLEKDLLEKKDKDIVRKIYEEDFDILSDYAFKNKMNFVEIFEYLLQQAQENIEEIKELPSVSFYDYKEGKLKSIRYTEEVNKELVKISKDIKIPFMRLISYLIKEYIYNIEEDDDEKNIEEKEEENEDEDKEVM